MRILALTLILVSIPIVSMSQHTEVERITTLEADMRGVRESLIRIEKKLAEATKETSILSDRLLEILLIVFIGADKAAYWRKRKNGTWTKPPDKR